MALRTFDTRAAADAACSKGGSVAGTYAKDGKTPVYFIVPADVSDEQMRRLAFQAKNGRPMSGYESTILELAEAGVK